MIVVNYLFNYFFLNLIRVKKRTAIPKCFNNVNDHHLQMRSLKKKAK